MKARTAMARCSCSSPASCAALLDVYRFSVQFAVDFVTFQTANQARTAMVRCSCSSAASCAARWAALAPRPPPLPAFLPPAFSGGGCGSGGGAEATSACAPSSAMPCR